MRNPFSPESRIGLLTAAAVAVLSCAASWAGLLAPADRAFEDVLVRAATHGSSRSIAPPDVAVVAIDPQSLRALPDWPWSRSVFARVLERLEDAGARAIAFDIDFSTARDGAGDEALARALAESGRAVLASFSQRQALGANAVLEVASLPAAPFVEAAAGLGSVLVPVDADGIVRRAPRKSPIGGEDRPSLARAALRVAKGIAVDAPLGSDQWYHVDYRLRRPDFPVLSLVDVLDGRFDSRDVAGRAVFIGSTAVELQDLWPTPLSSAEPGVFIQAVSFRTLAAELRGEAVLVPAPLAARMLAIVLLCLGLGVASSEAADRGRAVVFAAAAGAGGVGAWISLVGFGWLWSPAPLFGSVILQYVLGLEFVRRRIVSRLAAQETSLCAVAGVGTATTHPDSPTTGLEQALRLLAEGVAARRVCLLSSDEEGELDGQRIEWGAGGAREDEEEIAAAVLARRESRVDTLDRRTIVYSALLAGRAPVGVLVVECEGRELAPEERRTIATVAAQLALSAHNVRLIEHLRETFDSAISALATAVEARDGYTDLHCRRLAAFSAVMAERLGLPKNEVRAIELGALLHDVGKIGICDAVLNKPGRFTPEERRDMQRHPEIGAGIVREVRGLGATTLDCVLHHHERWDGAGYPRGLRGEEIPLAARIVSVVDVWDALSSARPYKAAYPQSKVISILQKGSGVEFDPALVELFLTILDEQGMEMLALIEDHNAQGHDGVASGGVDDFRD